MKILWLLTLLWQGMFSTPVPGGGGFAYSLQEEGREMAETLRMLDQQKTTLQGIVTHIQDKQQANTLHLEQLHALEQYLRAKTIPLMQTAQQGHLGLSGTWALDDYQKDLQQVLDRQEQLNAHQCLLAEAEAVYTQRLEQTEQEWNDHQARSQQLMETSGLQEIKTGGRPNQDAVIPAEVILPDYQPLLEDPKADQNSESQEQDHSNAGGLGLDDGSEGEDVKGEQDGGEAPDSDARATGNFADPESAPSQKTMDPNTGSIRNGPSFSKACPADGMDFSDFSGTLDVESGSFIVPVNGVVSGGTWAYYGGGMHLGLDLAAPMYTEVRAPAAGIVVYADTPVDSNCGYLGNYCGWPYGGGNTLCLLCVVNGQVFAITFAHLSSTIYVSPGQQVKQSDIIALSGNSGNSTGPHTHIEVFALSCSLEEAVRAFSYGADFSFGCGWDAPATCSGYGCRIRPESVFF